MREPSAARAVPPSMVDSVATATLRSHVGNVRTENQDRVGHALGPAGEIFIVADGVGGQSGGAEAADIAVAAYAALVSLDADLEESSPEAALQHATERVHEEIQREREAQPAFSGMATAIALLYLRDGVATVGHLGDSRVYLSRDGQLQRLTRDHSVVERMVDDGLLTEAEARVHPQGHILTRSLGQIGTPLDTQGIAVRPDDLLLLCSDGLWGCVSDEQLATELLRSGTDTVSAADSLLRLTLGAGAPDNVSLALVRIVRVPDRTDPPRAAQRLAVEQSAGAGEGSGPAKRTVSLALGVILVLVILAITYLHR